MLDANRINGLAEKCVSFGPFRLLPTQRLLMEGDKTVQLGSRAFDILLMLVQRAGELVPKEEIIARVWPNTFVAPANLAVHISALRRALADGRRGNRYVLNVPGRGYRFVAPVTAAEERQSSLQAVALTADHDITSPRMSGLAGIADDSKQRLPQRRLLTIVGPPGLDKLSVLAAVKKLLGSEAERHDVWLLDLTSIEPQRA
jgi:DNA-binding winged helix-turn-helix (wHTH) protein